MLVIPVNAVTLYVYTKKVPYSLNGEITGKDTKKAPFSQRERALLHPTGTDLQ